ncbi:hypothetical protein EB796_005749 [Bugula neritina]|uniref:Uncharacterized protein n=1 Tax=Bugula neritina TaxID=10212 RepID=A0A7J7KCL0_BUGNE|nr:hypothetical protein EB796_005749 [Bugula neritina]
MKRSAFSVLTWLLIIAVCFKDINATIDTCPEAFACTTFTEGLCSNGRRRVCMIRLGCGDTSSFTRACAPTAFPSIGSPGFTASAAPVCGFFGSSPAVFQISDRNPILNATVAAATPSVIFFPPPPTTTCTPISGACGISSNGLRITRQFTPCPFPPGPIIVRGRRGRRGRRRPGRGRRLGRGRGRGNCRGRRCRLR